MKIFLAGATGAIGQASLRILVNRGHRVFAMTRRPDRTADLSAAGAVAVVADVFDPETLRDAVGAANPDAVLHQLTDLAWLREPGKREEALRRNAEIRKTGTAHLVAAALSAGVERMVAQSIGWVYRPSEQPHREEDPLDLSAGGIRGTTIDAVATLEHLVLRTPGLQGCVLRYGQVYGPRTGKPDASGLDLPVHVEAAAWAAVLALEKQVVGVFNVAELNGYADTDKVRETLGWHESLRA